MPFIQILIKSLWYMEDAHTLRVSPAASIKLPSNVWQWDLDYLYSWQWAFKSELSVRAVACIQWPAWPSACKPLLQIEFRGWPQCRLMQLWTTQPQGTNCHQTPQTANNDKWIQWTVWIVYSYCIWQIWCFLQVHGNSNMHHYSTYKYFCGIEILPVSGLLLIRTKQYGPTVCMVSLPTCERLHR